MDPQFSTLAVALLTLCTALAGIITSTIQRQAASAARSKEAEFVRAALDTQAEHVRVTLDRQAADVRSALDRQAEVITLRHALLESKLVRLYRAIGANTALTRQGITKVENFADIANDVNQKIKNLGIDIAASQVHPAKEDQHD